MAKNPDNKKNPGKAGETGEIRQILIDKIEVADFCRRSDYPEEEMKTLRQSIQKRGLIQNPIVLDNGKGKFTLIVGSRRFRACKSLGWEALPCCVKKSSSQEAGYLSFAENTVRSMPHPVDQARLLQRMKENTSLSDKDLGVEVGLPQSGVTDRLSILNLGDDILAEIGSLPESPFKLTHAVILSQLMRTDRHYHQIEVRELLNKVKQYGLSSGELKRLVQLYKDGDYDRLTGGLRDLLIKSKYMTTRMAELFLHPERFINGDGHEAELLKQAAHQLTRDKREKFVQNAVDNKWSDEEIKKRFKRLLSPPNPEPKPSEADNAETLDSGILSLMKQLEDSQYQLVNFGPDQVNKLHKRCKRLMELLQSFVSTATEAAKDNSDTKESLKEESYENKQAK
jgi:ParB/RepB/Spo0J family partition protein